MLTSLIWAEAPRYLVQQLSYLTGSPPQEQGLFDTYLRYGPTFGRPMNPLQGLFDVLSAPFDYRSFLRAKKKNSQARSTHQQSTTSRRPELEQMARQAARDAGIDENIFLRMIEQESGWNPNARSPAGALGIAQIVPKYHPGVDPLNPAEALPYAARLLKSHLNRYGGDWRLALAAYNAGPGAVERYGGVPPYEETRWYVHQILGL
jgi:soluble lytic murein transglycosylase-like protein